MGILVVGSVALDAVKTPFGKHDEILGGSASYFSVAASYFTPVAMVAVVGEDFPESHVAWFQKKGIDTTGLQRTAGKTFRWKGEYGFDLNVAKTLDTQLNVFADFSPVIRAEHRSLDYVFLGNIDPDLQREVLAQLPRPKLIGCDTMNYWIENKRESLLRTIGLVDILIINDAETRQLAGQTNVIQAARTILSWGPKIIVIKRGEYGSLMIGPKAVFGAPAFPMDDVTDPTGAGDSFAGGFMGYLAARDTDLDEAALRKAVVFGTVMASFDVSEFGLRRLGELTYTEIEARFREFRSLIHVEGI
jgi:sugar/nucleoside kinase (ribokinase family)